MSQKDLVYIKEVFVGDYKCFKGEHIFKFASDETWCQWTIFLGDNNTGKTNLLKAIASLEPTSLEIGEGNSVILPKGFRVFENAQDAIALSLYPLVSRKKEKKNKTNLRYKYEDKLDGKYDLYICRDFTSSVFWNEQNARDLLLNLSIYAYGVNRISESKGIKSDNSKTDNGDNLFNNSKLINFEDWLFQLDYATKNDSAPDDNRKKARIRRDIIIDFLTSEVFPDIKDLRFVSDESLNNYIEFKTEKGWHKLSQLGYGYQASLSWMVDFCKKMYDRYPDSPDPLKEPAVLLIDEIDLHLHPQWQRSLIKYLSEMFPLTQFIVTTHSPFIIQSMSSVNLYILQKEDDHTCVKYMGHNSYIGWTIEEILREVMGLEDNIHTDIYQQWMKQFTDAIDEDNYQKGKDAYEALMKILHPQSEVRKLLDIQFSQLLPDD